MMIDEHVSYYSSCALYPVKWLCINQINDNLFILQNYKVFYKIWSNLTFN